VPDDDDKSKARERCLAVEGEQWKSDRKARDWWIALCIMADQVVTSAGLGTCIVRAGGAKESQRAKPQRS
jgi:hypothetical protein